MYKSAYPIIHLEQMIYCTGVADPRNCIAEFCYAVSYKSLTNFFLLFSYFHFIHIFIIDQARGQDGWILANFSFCVFMNRNEVELHKNVKGEQGQYPAILTELTKGFIPWHKEHCKKCSSYLFIFEHWKKKAVLCKSGGAYRFSPFLFPS